MRAGALALALTFGLVATSCGQPTAPAREQRWAADVPGGLVLVMLIVVENSTVEGEGFLGTLSQTQRLDLVITGTYGDSLHLTMQADLGSITFAGEYQPNGTLTGIIDGLGFDQQDVVFRR
jgi:hypothetical protein